MAKSRHRDSSEFYKGQIRERDKEIRSLRRMLKESKRHENFYEHLLDDIGNEVEPTRDRKCPSCFNGTLYDIDLKYVLVTKCNNEECTHLEKKKIKRTTP